MKRSLPVLLIVLSTLLSACGFHLRGTGEGGNFAIAELALSSREPHDELTRDVQGMLEKRGVQISEVADYRLVLGHLNESRRTTSYTPSTRGAEYELTSSLPFEIRSSDNLVLQRDTLEVQKTLVNDESNLVGTSEEDRRVRNEMQAELIQQLAMRLRQLTPAQLQQLAERARAAAQAPVQ